jgi:hypothetical protein
MKPKERRGVPDKRISDEVLFADYPGRPDPDRPVTDADVNKAQTMIRALLEAGKKTQFDFNPEEAKYLWAIKLKVFSIDVLTEAVNQFIDAPGNDFPSLGDMEQMARFVVAERLRDDREEQAATRGECEECGGVLYVRVVDGTLSIETYTSQRARRTNPLLEPVYLDVERWHMAPCPVCPEMERRRDLWDRGHWEADHVDYGGCPQCWEYHPSLAHRARASRRRATR